MEEKKDTELSKVLSVKEKDKIPCVVTTDKDKRGVFFCYTTKEQIKQVPDSKAILALNVQMCIYWTEPVKGVLGLASRGPDENSRVTQPVKAAMIDGVTAILEASDDAVIAWEKCPWR